MPTYALPCAPTCLTTRLHRPWNAPLPLHLHGARSFGGILSPEYCRRTVARPVSYYALFE